MTTPAQSLATAIQIASTLHESQLDKGGAPYILHPIRIAMRLRTEDYELMAIAILHDAIEDSAGTLTLEDLKKKGFSTRVLAALEVLTHERGSMVYERYIQLIGANPDATLVKIEDLRDNSDITRLKGLRKKDFERLEKYSKAYIYLTKIRDARTAVSY